MAPCETMMTAYHWLMLIPLLALLGIAAWTDLRWRIIPNWLNLAILFAGLTRAITDPWMDIGLGRALLGALLGFGLMFIPFALNALRGGDIKLMTALGAWLGPWGIFLVFVIEKLYGLVFVLAQATASGKLRQLAGNSARLAVNVAHVRDLGVEHVEESGRKFRSIDRPLPYAVPVLAAVLTLLLWISQSGW